MKIQKISFSGYNSQYDRYRKKTSYTFNLKKENKDKSFAAILEAANKNFKSV